jgi:hypothetical protein
MDLPNLGSFILSAPVVEFSLCAYTASGLAYASYVLNSLHVNSTSVFITCMLKCVPWVSMFSS